MYVEQNIFVNLIPENTAILKKPSKIFNKIKATITGDMTPTEAQQAEVMISVLQRLNTAFRACKVRDLVKIDINNKRLYDDVAGKYSDDIGFGTTHFSDSVQAGEFKSIHTIDMVLCASGDKLDYIIDTKIHRKPKDGKSPVEIRVTGLLKEFKLQKNETPASLHERILKNGKSQLTTKKSLKDLSQKTQNEFAIFSGELKAEVDELFPAKSYTNTLAIKSPTRNSTKKNQDFDTDFDYDADDQGLFASLLYLELWDLALEDLGFNSMSLADELGWQAEPNIIANELLSENITNFEPDTSTSGSDSSSSFWSDFSFDTGGDASSCGGGGGCGSCGS